MDKLTRRRLIQGAIAASAGASGLAAAAVVAKRSGLMAPDHGGVYGPGEELTYAAQRLMTRHAMAREFDPSQISKPPFPNGKPPDDPKFRDLQARAATDWRLNVDGMVARPASFSLADLKAMPSRSQITHIACEEGWSYIAEWHGVPLSHVLEVAGVQPPAKYVVYFSVQPDWWESVDMDDAMHPQTLVALGMNSGPLPVEFGGPIRVRVPRQLGYKSVKYISRITVTDDLKKFGKGLGSASPEGGYAWYAGI